jgi:hypothetical protein
VGTTKLRRIGVSVSHTYCEYGRLEVWSLKVEKRLLSFSQNELLRRQGLPEPDLVDLSSEEEGGDFDGNGLFQLL